MKDKRKQLFLLIAVVLIWGVIAWQLYAVLTPEEPSQSFVKKTMALPDTATVRPYQLLANYKDPFLKKGTANQSAGASRKVVIPSKRADPKPSEAVNWAAFKYLGTVENEHTKEQVALVSFNGKMLMLKRNDAIDGFRIVKVFKDSLHMAYSGQLRMIRRGQ